MVAPLLAWGGERIIIRSKEGEIGVRIIKCLLDRSGKINEPCKSMKRGWLMTPMGGWFGGMMESPIQPANKTDQKRYQRGSRIVG